MSGQNAEAFLPYYNLKEGLGRLRDNKKLYSKLLISYMASLKIEPIKTAIAEGRLPEAQELVHTVKGTSANLSVNGMFEAALALEKNIKAGEDTAENLANLEKVAAKVTELYPEVAAYLAQE